MTARFSATSRTSAPTLAGARTGWSRSTASTSSCSGWSAKDVCEWRETSGSSSNAMADSVEGPGCVRPLLYRAVRLDGQRRQPAGVPDGGYALRPWDRRRHLAAPPQAHSFVQLFVEVEDIAADVDKAKALGAMVLIPPQRLPEGDQLAILRDPEGMSFGLMQPAARAAGR